MSSTIESWDPSTFCWLANALAFPCPIQAEDRDHYKLPSKVPLFLGGSQDAIRKSISLVFGHASYLQYT